MSWVETTEDPRAGTDASRGLADSLSEATQGQLDFAFRPAASPDGDPGSPSDVPPGGECDDAPGAATMSLGLEEWLEERVSLVDDGGLRAMGVAAQAHGYLWVPLEPPGPQFRGRLGLYIEESVESELERLGALSPGIHASTGLDASLSDQLYRARLVEKRGIALTLPSLEGICNLGRILDADDGAVLRWWIAATGERPVRVVVSRKNSSLRVYPSPVLFESLFEVAPYPLSPRPPCAHMAESRDTMELSDLPPEVSGPREGARLLGEERGGPGEETDVFGTTLGPAAEGDSLFAELWGSSDVDLPELDDALGLSAAPAPAGAGTWETEEVEPPVAEESEAVWSALREAPTMAPEAGDEPSDQSSLALRHVRDASDDGPQGGGAEAPMDAQINREQAESVVCGFAAATAGGAAPAIPDLELGRPDVVRALPEGPRFELPEDLVGLESETPLMPVSGRLDLGSGNDARHERIVVSSPLGGPAGRAEVPQSAADMGLDADEPEETRPTRPGGVVGVALAKALSARGEDQESPAEAEPVPLAVADFAGLDPDEFLRTLAEDSARAPEVEERCSADDLVAAGSASAVLSAPASADLASATTETASERALDQSEATRSDGASDSERRVFTGSHSSPQPLPTKKIRPFLRMATEEESAQLSSQPSAGNPTPAPVADASSVEGANERPRSASAELDASTADPADPFNQLAARDWRKWVKNLEQARGPKPLSVVERMFVTDYTRLREALRRNIADASAGAVLEEWRESFARSYTEAFDALRMRGKRPTMVLDLPEVAQRLARLQGARRLQLLLIDGMRFDLGLMIQERMKTRVDAALTERLLMWSALPTTTTTQLELLGRGPEGLKEPLPSEEDEPPALVARGRGAATARRIRTGRLELYKIDVIEDELRQVGEPVLSRFGQIADVAADAICSHLEKQPPRTLVVVFGDHGFAIDPAREKTTAEVHQGGASPEEVLVPAFAWLTGAVH